MCLCRVPKMPPVSVETPGGNPAPLGSVGSGGSSVTANLTATAVVGVIVELISCSHGVDIRQPVRATRGHAHLPRGYPPLTRDRGHCTAPQPGRARARAHTLPTRLLLQRGNTYFTGRLYVCCNSIINKLIKYYVLLSKLYFNVCT